MLTAKYARACLLNKKCSFVTCNAAWHMGCVRLTTPTPHYHTNWDLEMPRGLYTPSPPIPDSQTTPPSSLLPFSIPALIKHRLALRGAGKKEPKKKMNLPRYNHFSIINSQKNQKSCLNFFNCGICLRNISTRREVVEFRWDTQDTQTLPY